MEFDINTLRGLFTLLLMIGFVGMTVWVFSRKRKSYYERAAELPFIDDKHNQLP